MKRYTFVCSHLEASGASVLREPHNEDAVVGQVFSAVPASEVGQGLHIELPSAFSDALVNRVLAAFKNAYDKPKSKDPESKEPEIKFDVVVTAGDYAAWSSEAAQEWYQGWLERSSLLDDWQPLGEDTE